MLKMHLSHWEYVKYVQEIWEYFGCRIIDITHDSKSGLEILRIDFGRKGIFKFPYSYCDFNEVGFKTDIVKLFKQLHRDFEIYFGDYSL